MSVQEHADELDAFYAAIREDHRIGPTHISLYMAIFYLYSCNNFVNPVPVRRVLLMELTKISGLATYHKCLKELVEGGYVKYEPSHTARVKSKIYLLTP